MAINNEDASLDSPPLNLTVSLMPARASESNPFRKREKSPPKTPTPSSNIITPQYLPYPFPGYPPYVPPYLPTHGMPYKVSSPPGLSSKRIDPLEITIPSSPPEAIDPVDRMHNFFIWLRKKSPSQAGVLSDTENLLLKMEYNFNTMFRITEAKWDSWNVPEGIRAQILDGVSRFKRAELSL